MSTEGSQKEFESSSPGRTPSPSDYEPSIHLRPSSDSIDSPSKRLGGLSASPDGLLHQGITWYEKARQFGHTVPTTIHSLYTQESDAYPLPTKIAFKLHIADDLCQMRSQDFLVLVFGLLVVILWLGEPWCPHAPSQRPEYEAFRRRQNFQNLLPWFYCNVVDVFLVLYLAILVYVYNFVQ